MSSRAIDQRKTLEREMKVLTNTDPNEIVGLMATPGHDENEIDYAALARIPEPGQRHVATKLAIKKVNYVSLSDALVNRNNGGNFVLVYLENESQSGRVDPSTGLTMPNDVRQWKIQILCDEFGNPPKPGDVHKWKFGVTKKDEFGVKLTSRTIKEIRRKGLGHTLEEWHGDTIDEYGCIKLPYKDAVLLLDNYGVHYMSNQPITMMKEITSWQKKNPLNGSMVNVRNWRYREIPPGFEGQLKSLKQGQLKPKRKKRNEDIGDQSKGPSEGQSGEAGQTE
jgi:hypothetical protein